MLEDITNNYHEERRKILDGSYSLIIAQGKQNKHIPGTKEFLDKENQMRQEIQIQVQHEPGESRI